MVFKALNDKTRRDILELLKDSDMTVSKITEHFIISMPSISHHLDILKQAGLVISYKKKRYVYYSINTSALEDTFKWIFNLTN